MSQKRFLRIVNRKNGNIHAYSVNQIIFCNLTGPSGDRTLNIMHERRPTGDPQAFSEADFDISDFVNELKDDTTIDATEERQVEV